MQNRQVTYLLFGNCQLLGWVVGVEPIFYKSRGFGASC